ncbi:16S rRNA (cytidine(1402)-2'-O)-methyltransferase [Catenovulum sp. SX2]|uniref:16S rRNA (cytidine(1402)-2'-O)-methyltransferase n=1 Tax=Catenovulum sp. SX2 TaxID=3398614 RepID=UPI003F8733C6
MQDHTAQTSGILYVVATPIGNLADFTQRAIDTLNLVDVIAAEDTRNAYKLLQHFSIDKKCIAYHDHNETQQAQSLVKQLLAGANIGLISDAGTPLINDPGYRIVKACREANIKVVPIPGACAIITALSAAGVATDQFFFGGFLPAKKQARQAAIATTEQTTATSVFYESTHRIVACLGDIQAVLGTDKHVVIARELTKTFETFISAPVSEILQIMAEDSNQLKGEFVLVLEGSSAQAEVDEKCLKLLKSLVEYMPLKAAAGIVADTFGVKKKAVYEAGLTLD